MLFAAGALLACAGPARAEDLSKEFRRAFENTFLEQRTYAVATQAGIPTTSIYGVEGDSENAHYSIDIVDGRWKTSTGWLDSDQNAADYLREGEILELASVSYKDNRVDLRMVSLEAHKVTRGAGFAADTDPEPVATNFKFFLPFPKERSLVPADMPEVEAYIRQFLQPFADLHEARLHAARLILKLDTAAGSVGGGGDASELKVGMTQLQVIEVLGMPDREIAFGAKTKWAYPDVAVIFEDCRVADVEF
jgi:hypothetical protein